MPAVGRVNGKDFAQCPSHTCVKKLCCPHNVQGPAVKGAKEVNVNGSPCMFLTTQGVHDKGTCCGPNKWVALQCAGNHEVIVEGHPIFAVNDISLHDGRDQGKLMLGSENVFVK